MNLINTRESQFELLRIVAIFMVLIHHSLAVADTFVSSQKLAHN